MVRHVVLAFALALALAHSACGGGGGGGGGTGGSGSSPSTPTTYTLSGRVTTNAPALAPIQGATVAVADGPNAAKSATTDGNGAYTLSGLQPGGFTLRISATGYDTTSHSVTLTGNQTLDVQLLDTPRTLDQRIAAHRYPRLLERVVATGLTDGIFYDWITDGVSWLNYRSPSPSGPLDIDNDGRADPDATLDARWIAGTQTLLDNSRRIFPPGTIVGGNAGWIVSDVYDSRLNGALFEQFLGGESLSRESFGWTAVMRAYHGHCAGTMTPRLNLLMANRDAADSFTFMRFSLASALMADGYFTFTNQSNSYASDWWYDEYSVDLATGRAERSLAYKGYLGTPTGAAYNATNTQERFADVLAAGGTLAEDRVWRRDFTNGTVLVNPTSRAVTVRLETAYRKIRGTVDPGFNDGQTVTDVTLPARSGIVLLTLARTADEQLQAELAGRR